MTDLSSQVFIASQVRELDRIAIEDRGISGYTLMSRAGEAVFDLLKQYGPSAKSLCIMCGAGNNAGDGYVVARIAAAAGLKISVMALVDPGRLSGDAALAFSDFRDCGIEPVAGFENLPAVDVYVDAMLGTGLDRPLDGSFLAAVRALNASETPVLAVDIPTGLHADSGLPLGDAVHADATLSFIGLKSGYFLGDGPELTGALFYDDLGVPADIADGMQPLMLGIDRNMIASVLRRRKRTAHKGSHGHVLIIGGGRGMPGAVRLAGEAALRSGAGLVTLATHPDHAHSCTGDRPELMCRGVSGREDLENFLGRASVIAIGPGLGTDEWASDLVASALEARDRNTPLIIDADALNLLAQMPSIPQNQNRIATPHPGEAARLLNTDTASIQQDRLAAVAALQKLLGGVVVLKGAATLVSAEKEIVRVCRHGNPGMASAGFGDVLTGICAGVVAQIVAPGVTPGGTQGVDLFPAACCAVDAHARAADLAAAGWERGLIASDIFPYLRSCLNPKK